MAVHHLDRDEARRIAIWAQSLDARRPDDLLAVVNRLTCGEPIRARAIG